MPTRLHLESEDRAFFDGVRASAFTNPFGGEPVQIKLVQVLQQGTHA